MHILLSFKAGRFELGDFYFTKMSQLCIKTQKGPHLKEILRLWMLEPLSVPSVYLLSVKTYRNLEDGHENRS